jgi:hypothetical protein
MNTNANQSLEVVVSDRASEVSPKSAGAVGDIDAGG